MEMFSLLWLYITIALAVVVNGFTVNGVHAGVDPKTGFRPFRLEIKDFQYAGPAFDLYILALRKFMDANKTDPLSFFQIAGIHGYPNVPWDTVQATGDTEYVAGYCQHFSILFLTWHRPYMALVEQLVWENAQKIAKEYPESVRGRYQNAAITMRLPYWDWSLDHSLPSILSEPMISVNTPQGFQPVINPLYNYTFHPALTPQELPWDSIRKFPATVRRPDNYGQSQPALVEAALRSKASVLHGDTYKALSSKPNYQAFSNAADGRPNSDGINLENIHNLIHLGVGGDGGPDGAGLGQFAYPSTGAFDPVFFLHHVNVDRLLAIYQALYPDSYVVPQAATQATFTNKAGDIQDINSPLYPFHSTDDGQFHTSASVRATKTFGYSYPEVWDWVMDGEKLAASVRERVNKMYHPDFKTRQNVTMHTPHVRRKGAKRRAPAGTLGAALAADWEWSIVTTLDVSKLENNALLSVFPSDDTTSPVGSLNLIIPFPKGPSKLRNNIPLTSSLLMLPSLDPDTVLPHLKNYTWKVSGTELQEGALTIEVLARTVQQTKDIDQFPIYGEWKSFGEKVLQPGGSKVL